MRILVTGASGLLGANLALEAARQHTVIGTYHQRPLKTSAFQFRQVNLLDPGALENLLESSQPEWIIHCAAQANLDACEKEPTLAYQQNVDIPRRLATLVGKSGARLLHVSTDAVFDGRRGDYSETDRPNPLNVYARTKLEAEEAVLGENPQALVVRVNLFGWSPDTRRSLAEFFYYNLKAMRPVEGFTDVLFCPLLANDLAQLFLQMLEQRLNGLYHAFSPTWTSKYEFGVALARRFGLDGGLIAPASVAAAGLSAARSPNLTMRSERLSQALGRPLPAWEAGLEKLYLQHQQGYNAALQAMNA